MQKYNAKFLQLFKLVTTGENDFDAEFINSDNGGENILYYRFPTGDWYYVEGGALELVFGDDIIAKLEAIYQKEKRQSQ